MVGWMKGFLGSLVLVWISSISTAQPSPGNCDAFPTVPPNFAELSPDEQRGFAIEIAAYQACVYERFRDNRQRKISSGDAEMLESAISFFKQQEQLFSTREKFPIAAFRERIQLLQPPEHFRDLITYMNLANEIMIEDDCATRFGTDGCTQASVYSGLKAEGKDPRAEFEAIGQRVRFENVPAWFVIGQVKVDDSARSDRAFNLREDLRAAKRRYDSAMETLELREAQLDDASKLHQDRVAELKKKPQELRDRIDEIRAAHRPNPDEVRASQDHANLVSQIESADRRIEEIDRAVKYLFENSTAEDTFSRDRIRALQDELEQVNRSRDEADAAIDKMILPELPEEAQRKVDALEDELEIEGNDARRRIALEDSRLESARTLWTDAKAEVRQLEGPYLAADAALRAFRKEGELAVKGISSEHAEILLTGARQYEQLEFLKRQVRQLESAQLRVDRVRETARRQMIEAAEEADRMNEVLLHAGYRSIAAQSMVEITDALWSVRKAAAGGPGAILAESAKQIMSNLTFPPSYYDAKGGKLEDYFKRRDTSAEHEASGVAKLDKVAYSSFKTAVKQMMFAPAKNLAEMEKIDFLKAARDTAVKAGNEQIAKEIEKTGMANVADAMKPAFDIIEKLESTEKKLANARGKNGWKEMGKAQGVSFLKSVLKSAGKEVIKKEMADFLEQPHFDAYMNAQVDLAGAVQSFRSAGDIYWQLEEELKRARGLRDAALEAFDPDTGQFVEKNEPFFADPDYAITLNLADETERSFDSTVTLGGLELRRDTRTTAYRWVLPDNAPEKLTVDSPEKLDLIIKLQ